MSDSDLQEIRDVVARIEHAQHGELVDEFVALFRPDAVWTTAHGKRLYGRDAIAEFTARVLPGATAAEIATYEIDRVVFLRPDVAAVTVRQQYRNRSGVETTAGAPMYVMTKEDGRWLLAANQNTGVVGA
ncbi:SgcJ/EcaC family oxidoreductase [Nocardia sp. NPDC052254]|uniref:SgcJ/EcaC family oxidoreductase n=1 Tax=Nocardia sp. NPDC052254 TaxID=3155681 RepID=UPI00341DA1BD